MNDPLTRPPATYQDVLDAPKDMVAELIRELREGVWVLAAALEDDHEVRVAPFEAVGLSLAALWPD